MDNENMSWDKIANQKEINEILNRITKMKYGSVTLIFHDGKVVQIEKIEKYKV